MDKTSGCLDLSIAAPRCLYRIIISTAPADSGSGLESRHPYSDRSSRDKPQKTMTPIAAMTNNSSSVAGTMVFKSFIPFTFTSIRDGIDATRVMS